MKRKKNEQVRLGCVEISLPTATDSKCSIFMDLAEAFGVETNGEAAELLRDAWKLGGAKGRLSIDRESDFVSIISSRETIVEVAVLIHRHSAQGKARPLEPDEVDAALERIKKYKRPARRKWGVGDFFALDLDQGCYAYGQVLGVSGSRAPTCALLELLSATPEVDVEAVKLAKIIAILHVSANPLDDGEWRVVGTAAPMADPGSGPCGRAGEIGSRFWNGLETLARAYHGLAPWNPYYGDDFLDQYLMPGITRPPQAIMLGRAALEARGIQRSSWR